MNKKVIFLSCLSFAILGALIGFSVSLRISKKEKLEIVSNCLYSQIYGSFIRILYDVGGLSEARERINEEKIFWNLGIIQTSIDSGELSAEQREKMTDLILIIKDFVEITGYQPFSGADEEEKSIEELKTQGVPLDIRINEEVFTASPQKAKLNEMKEIFQKYSGRHSSMYEFIKDVYEGAEPVAGDDAAR